MSTDPSDPFIQHILDVDVIPCLSFSNKQVSICTYVVLYVQCVYMCTRIVVACCSSVFVCVLFTMADILCSCQTYW